MSLSELPYELYQFIFPILRHPGDWINSMRTCKNWKEIIQPMYLKTDFRVMMIKWIQTNCKLQPKTGKFIVNPMIIDSHFMTDGEFSFYIIPGLYLPFMRYKKHMIKIDTNEMLKYYMFKFPNQNKNNTASIQEVSLREKEYITECFNYRQRLAYEINKFYSDNENLIGTDRYDHDMKYLKIYEKESLLNTFKSVINCLKYFFRKNCSGVCPFCCESHYEMDEAKYGKHMGSTWEYTYPSNKADGHITLSNTITSGGLSNYACGYNPSNTITVSGSPSNWIDLDSTRTLTNRTFAINPIVNTTIVGGTITDGSVILGYSYE